MSSRPTLEDESIEYGAEIVTGGEPGVPDTVILVTKEGIHARPIAGKEDESTLEFSLPMDKVDALECDGFFSQAVTVASNPNQYTIPSAGLDSITFASTVIEHSGLSNQCNRLGFGLCRFSVCKWLTCLGCALLLVGAAFSITMIGVIVGLPFIVGGGLFLASAFVYQRLGNRFGDNVWTRIEQPAETRDRVDDLDGIDIRP